MNKTIKTVAVGAVACLACAAIGLSACSGGRKISGTYKVEYDQEYVSTHMGEFEGGAQSFLTMAKAYSANTVTFNEDGTYSYVKDLQGPELRLALTITYTGTYSDGSTEYNGTTENSYILNKPTAAEWTFNPGMTCIAGWGNGTVYSEDWADHLEDEYSGDMNTQIWIGAPVEAHNIIDYFLGSTLLFNSTEGLSDDEIYVEVAVDAAAGTLIYLEDYYAE